jgi:hypothetical protein
MDAVDRERERRDDHCPACGEDIDWESGWHSLDGEAVRCLTGGHSFDVAVLDLAHLND